jgi:hypothetical protein
MFTSFSLSLLLFIVLNYCTNLESAMFVVKKSLFKLVRKFSDRILLYPKRNRQKEIASFDILREKG